MGNTVKFGRKQKTSKPKRPSQNGAHHLFVSMQLFEATALIAILGIGVFYLSDSIPQIAKVGLRIYSIASSCNIKGNVSYNNGQKIFHVPGQRDYNSTVISSQRGERWFCSEADARAHGWRKASR